MPDAGRPGRERGARERVARLVCSDADQLAPARSTRSPPLHAAQVGQIEAAARQVATRVADADAPVVAFGAARSSPARRRRGSAGRSPRCRGQRPSATRPPPPRSPTWPPPACARRADGRQGRRRAGARGRRRRAARAVRGDRGAGARHPLLVVPGGGEFADAVRAQDRRLGLRPQTAHWMAILAMDAFGWALADLIPGASGCTDLAPAAPARRRGPPRLRRCCAERDPLPESWAVTSDSIAAWVAGAAGAARSCSSSRSTASTARGRRPATRSRG